MNKLTQFSKKFLELIFMLLVICVVAAGVRAIIPKPVITEPTDYATATTSKNAFVSGCKGENTTEQYCGCAYDRLLIMYPDFNTNQARIHRILTEGYNSAETDTMVSCTLPTLST